MSDTTNAGEHKFKVVSPKGDGTNYESAQVKLVIVKAEYTGTKTASKDVRSDQAFSGVTVTPVYD